MNSHPSTLSAFRTTIVALAALAAGLFIGGASCSHSESRINWTSNSQPHPRSLTSPNR